MWLIEGEAERVIADLLEIVLSLEEKIETLDNNIDGFFHELIAEEDYEPKHKWVAEGDQDAGSGARTEDPPRVEPASTNP